MDTGEQEPGSRGSAILAFQAVIENPGSMSADTGASCASWKVGTYVPTPTDPGRQSAYGCSDSDTGLDLEEERVQLVWLKLRVHKALRLPSYDAFHHHMLTKGWLVKISDGGPVFVRLRDKKRVGLERLGLREAFWWRVVEWDQNVR